MVLLDDPEFDIGTPQLSEAALEQIFSKTAIQVFGLSPDSKQ